TRCAHHCVRGSGAGWSCTDLSAGGPSTHVARDIPPVSTRFTARALAVARRARFLHFQLRRDVRIRKKTVSDFDSRLNADFEPASTTVGRSLFGIVQRLLESIGYTFIGLVDDEYFIDSHCDMLFERTDALGGRNVL